MLPHTVQELTVDNINVPAATHEINEIESSVRLSSHPYPFRVVCYHRVE
jgi:hypothetical protein